MSKALVHACADCVVLTTDAGLSVERIASLEGVKVVALHCILSVFYRALFMAGIKEACC